MQFPARTLSLVVSHACLVLANFAFGQEAVRYSEVTDERLRNPEPGNWLMFRRTYDGWGYSPLDQINTRNVDELVAVWSVSTGITEGHQSPPIVNDGLMFVTTPMNQVHAIEAASGDVVWTYRRQMPFDLRLMHPTNRGVALYGDKVFMATSDAKLVALAADTGTVIWETAVEDYNGGYYITMAPLAAHGRIMVGVSGGELGIRGFVAAFDAETGEQIWKTYTIPGPGEFGNDSWPGDSWQTGGAPVWVTGTFDPELNLTYWGTGNPGPWIGEARPGDSLYANSVIALDVDTGELKGYHQYHWNGSWDWDEVSAPLLIDVQRDGRRIPGLVHAGRNGYLWLLERRPDSIRYIDARPYVYQNVFTHLDPVTGRPAYDMARKPGIGRPATFCPSLHGGKNWPPAAYNPQTGYLYIPANNNLCTTMAGEAAEYRRGQNFTGVDIRGGSIANEADHVGELQAWDLDSGERVWTHEFGEFANWGPVLTTAGGLVFQGGTADRWFRAFDARTGELLWQQRLNSGITGVPSAFEAGGRQYIAVQSGWGVDAAGSQRRVDGLFGNPETIVPQGGVVWVFALP
ncbi:MAG: PQQ-dependent dehydrogenase, methanol/ethanol family [Gammaproteobacteria bacterium]